MTAQPYVLGGDVDLPVVGESYYQDNLRQIVAGAAGRVRVHVDAVLNAEIDNHYDPNAVSVWVRGLQAGHLARDVASRYRPGLVALGEAHGSPIALRGVVIGEDMLGVFLSHDPRDFGIETAPAPRPHDGDLRTGLSDAIATDGLDDSYDLSWMATLPYDTNAAIARLRDLLKDERDPLDRHFMFHELEGALYGSRNVVPTALTEFDEVCRRHDVEMEAMRSAFLVKWGRVPWLQTYRQMCIRKQKEGDFKEALQWAERGVAIYGSDAARPEALDDLRARAALCRTRLEARAGRQGAPRVAASLPSAEEVLTCAECGQQFRRIRARGRKPSQCPACRSDPAPSPDA